MNPFTDIVDVRLVISIRRNFSNRCLTPFANAFRSKLTFVALFCLSFASRRSYAIRSFWFIVNSIQYTTIGKEMKMHSNTVISAHHISLVHFLFSLPMGRRCLFGSDAHVEHWFAMDLHSANGNLHSKCRWTKWNVKREIIIVSIETNAQLWQSWNWSRV